MAAVGGYAGAYMAAVGKYQEGKAAKQAHDYNAERAEERAAFEEEQSRLRWKRLMGHQLALYAKAGVDIDSGSPLLIMSAQAGEAELEALNIRYAGENEAEMQRWYGKKTFAAGKMAAWSTLLSGAGGTSSGYSYRGDSGGTTTESKSSDESYEWHRSDRQH